MKIKKIAFSTDFSRNSDDAFEMAVDLAEKYQAELAIIHIIPPVINPLMMDMELMPVETSRALIVQIEEKMGERYGKRIPQNITYQFIVRDGHVPSEIVRYLEESETDLVVMGSFGLTGMGLVFFGSVAQSVSNQSPCSVIIVREKM